MSNANSVTIMPGGADTDLAALEQAIDQTPQAPSQVTTATPGAVTSYVVGQENATTSADATPSTFVAPGDAYAGIPHVEYVRRPGSSVPVMASDALPTDIVKLAGASTEMELAAAQALGLWQVDAAGTPVVVPDAPQRREVTPAPTPVTTGSVEVDERLVSAEGSFGAQGIAQVAAEWEAHGEVRSPTLDALALQSGLSREAVEAEVKALSTGINDVVCNAVEASGLSLESFSGLVQEGIVKETDYRSACNAVAVQGSDAPMREFLSRSMGSIPASHPAASFILEGRGVTIRQQGDKKIANVGGIEVDLDGLSLASVL